jgi:hypothetical protein
VPAGAGCRESGSTVDVDVDPYDVARGLGATRAKKSQLQRCPVARGLSYPNIAPIVIEKGGAKKQMSTVESAGKPSSDRKHHRVVADSMAR